MAASAEIKVRILDTEIGKALVDLAVAVGRAYEQGAITGNWAEVIEKRLAIVREKAEAL